MQCYVQKILTLHILHMFPDQPHRMQQHVGVMNVETVDMCLACLASSQAMTSE